MHILAWCFVFLLAPLPVAGTILCWGAVLWGALNRAACGPRVPARNALSPGVTPRST
jgi:hypothetical protein